MKIKEHSSSRMVVTRGSAFDSAIFALFILVGLGMMVFSPTIGPPTWPWLLLGLAFTGAGTYFWRLSGDMTLTLDRRSGVARLDWRNGRGANSQTAALTDIVELRVEDGNDADRLVFHLKGGATLPLTPYSYTGGDHPKVRRAINAWLSEPSE